VKCTGWKPVPPRESRTPPEFFVRQQARIDKTGLFYLIYELVKRKRLIRHLIEHGAFLLREGRRHSIYQKGNFKTLIPHHTKIIDELARKICKDLDIPWVKQ
jgi:hypothetical protein